MKQYKWMGFGLAGGLLSLTVAAGASSFTPEPLAGAVFEVTITNLTAGQVLSPPLVATHSDDDELFVLGQPSSPELAMLAEDATTAPLAQLLMSSAGVADVQVGAGPIPPGASQTIRVMSSGRARFVSLASMLVNTNDAFVGLDALELPAHGEATSFLAAYDAGSEANTELCRFIPGPACSGMGAGVHDPSPSEGFVHVSPGIHGVGDLDPAAYDWRNPSAYVTVRRVTSR